MDVLPDIADGAPLPDTGHLEPARLSLPLPGVAPSALVLASPHSGRNYPAAFLAASRLDAHALRQSEDSYVDELFADGPAAGVALLEACFPRAFCDVNRDRWELDPDMFVDPLPSWCSAMTPRIAAGYGTVPRVVANGERIHRQKLTFAEAAARIETCWEPYHRALADLLAATRVRFGACLLIDCHSMPAERTGSPADFVLGDNHGTSCAPSVVDLVEARLGSAGFRVRRNDPYAGGYVTRHYGRPAEGIHVLQLEVARSLYLDEERREKHAGFPALRHELGALVALVAARRDLLA